MEDVKELKTLEEIKVFSDPYRYKILDCFYFLDEPATAKRVADEMKEAPAKIHYHVKKMEQAGILKLVHTKVINGITAKYYEPAARKFKLGASEEATNKEELLGETKNTIDKLFEEAKNSFLSYLGMDEKSRGSASMGDLYITEEQMKELITCIEGYIDKNSTRQNKEKEGINKYQFFFSIIKKND